ncbi:M23 family metallopeptidase [Pseudonocardia thermophila]|uniref:M23 family metallopeptidase n=1 Tax=Pseudonocardia thermophila TaxID=1848 RepID=UPI00248D5AE4|nr:M23 family metallopeptidase [Pseudonocardia thermophila]
MARHRSPSGRAHLPPPLTAALAAAGAGGAARPHSHAASPAGSTLADLTQSTPLRIVAGVVVGGALAAAGHQALSSSGALDGIGTTIGTSIGTAFAATAAATTNTAADTPQQVAPATVATTGVDAVAQAAESALATVADQPQIADAAALIKAAGLNEAAKKAAEEKAAAEKAAAEKAVAEKKAAQTKAAAGASSGGAVQMIVGRITSGFGARWGTTHQGLDIAAPIGTPIRAPAAGTVISSGPASGFGLWVRLQHADGTITVYGHINRSLVKVGQKVNAGDVIAEVGNRGQSTGPHLHIGVMQNGRYVDPRPWLNAQGVKY